MNQFPVRYFEIALFIHFLVIMICIFAIIPPTNALFVSTGCLLGGVWWAWRRGIFR